MKVEELRDYISSYAVEVLKENGINELYPPQAECIDKVFSDRNLILALPTASGKTLLAELVMLREILKGGKCLYTVPLRALASEKFREFGKWEKIGVKVGISTGDYEARDEHLGDCDIIVTTSEKADSLMRNRARWMDSVTCLIVDELHLIDSARRGAALEILIAKMMRRDVRIVGLSATAPNVAELAGWLNAEHFVSNWRPVPLSQGVLCRGKLEMYGEGGELLYTKKADFHSLVEECVSEGGKVLVFESTRRNAESTAVKLCEKLRISGSKKAAKRIIEENDGEMSIKLAECVEQGVAFHHAGLLSGQREAVEDEFRRGDVHVIVATPTLAAGVNLPARRVIVKSIYRYDGYARRIKVMEYKQMAGRAGRPGMDEEGEAIMIVQPKDRKLAVENYILGEPERITSKLGAETHLRFHSLSLLCEGYARSVRELSSFFSDTLFFRQNDISPDFELERVVNQLEKWGMVSGSNEGFMTFDDRQSRNLSVTDFGMLVSRLYIDPLTGFIFKDVLEKCNLSDLGILHLVCRTPDMERLYLRKYDDWVEEEAFAVKDELSYFPSTYSTEYEWFLSEVKTALCLRDWIEEIDENVICEKYSIAPGDLRRIVETAEWLLNALRRVAEFVNYEEVGRISSLTLRMRHGVKEELLNLIEIKGVGRVRARKLYDRGIKTIDDVVKREDTVLKILGKRLGKRIVAAAKSAGKTGGS